MAARRLFTVAFNARVGLEARTGVKSAAARCREPQRKPHLVAHGKAPRVARAPALCGSPPDGRDAQERSAELARMVGRLTLELAVAKKASPLVTSRVRSHGR